MTYSELTGTQLIKNFGKFMTKVMEGIPLVFEYKGKTFEIVVKEQETQGQKLVRLLNQNKQHRDKQLPAVDNRDIYKLLKKYD